MPAMSDVEQVSHLIGEIYDTTLNPDRWTGALEKIVDFMRGKTAVLASEEIGGAPGSFHYSWGDNPEYSKLFREKYASLNPAVVPVAISVQPGEVCSISTVMSYEEFLRSRLYNEWAKPQDYGDVTTVVIEKSATSFAHLGIAHYRRDSPANDEARKRLSLLAPHICRAVTISKAIDLSRIEAALLGDTIDTLAAGVFLLQGNGCIAHMNASGKAALKEGHLFQEVDGALQTVDQRSRTVLHSAIAEAAQGDKGLNGRAATIPLMSTTGERYVVHILSLASGARARTGRFYRAAVAVFVHKATLHRPTLIETVAAQFKLTPSELRVMFAIIEVGGAPQVARVLGISIDTVKTHLKRVFAKTETKRQADLVKLIVGYMNPLIS